MSPSEATHHHPRASQSQYASVSIVVPTYKEVLNIPLLVERLAAVRTAHGFTMELLLMDDNSGDGSAELVESLNLEWVRLITRTSNRGLSYAVMDGLRAARHDVLVVMDADLSHPPEKIPDLLNELAAGAQFAIGSRFVQGGTTDDDWGFFRWLNSRVATLLAAPFANVKDPMSGFFALRRDTLENAAALNPVGYKIGLELLVKCRCKRIAEVPIHFQDRQFGESKLSFKEQLRYLDHIGRLYKYKYGITYDLTQFLVVGLLGTAVNVVSLTLLLGRGVRIGAAVAVAIGLSMLFNFILYRRFNFSHAKEQPIGSHASRFFFAYAPGALANYVVTVALLVNADPSHLAFGPALAGIAVGAIFNVIANRYLAFQARHVNLRVAKAGWNIESAGEADALRLRRDQRYDRTVMITCMLLTLMAAAVFLPKQSLWVDETTQLSGISLHSWQIIPYLGGRINPFHVPPDRAPPLSYFVDKLWATIFGLTIPSLRWLGVLMVTGAVGVIWGAARRVVGLAGALAAALLLGLNPTIVTESVEIRAYPLLLLLAACALYCMIRHATREKPARQTWLFWLTVFCIAAIYTHFFGLVLAGALFTATFVAEWLRDRRIGWTVVAGAICFGSAIGLIPFITGARQITNPAAATPAGHALRYFFLHLAWNPALGMSRVVSGVALLAFAGLILMALLRTGLRAHTTARGRALLGIVAGLVAGVVVVVAATFIAHGFNPAATHYNIWIFPPLCILLAAGVASHLKSLRAAAALLAIVLIGGYVYGDGQLATRGHYFAHGTVAPIEALIHHYGVKNVAIIMDRAPRSAAAPDEFNYFPLVYLHGEALPQYLATANGDLVPVRHSHDAAVAAHALHRPYLIVLQSASTDTADILRQLHHGPDAVTPGPIALQLRAAPDFTLVDSEKRISFISTQIWVFHRNP